MNYCCKKQNKVKKWLIITAWKKKFRLLKICEKGRKDHIFVSFRMFSFHGNIMFSELSLKRKGKKAASFRKCVFLRKYEIFVYDSVLQRKQEIFCWYLN